jgi:hypothetical protein
MNLRSLAERLDYELGEEHEHEDVLLMTPSGRRFEILSLNWDDERGHWVLIGDRCES